MNADPFPAGARLCRADAVPDGGAREILLDSGEIGLSVVLFRQGERVVAYRNRCPHFLLPLNAGPGRFILMEDGLVMCAWHSAVFRIMDGAGIDGPCMGASLEALAIAIEGGNVILAPPLEKRSPI